MTPVCAGKMLKYFTSLKMVNKKNKGTWGAVAITNLNCEEILQSFWHNLRLHSCTQKLFSCDHTKNLVGHILIV